MTIMRIIPVILLLLASMPAIGTEIPATTYAEVEYLLKALSSSSCEFYRNGDWHRAPEAEAHLRKKYNYLVKKGMISKAEEFIAKGATESSLSGEPYQVRCPNEAAQPSAVWLSKKLQALRENASK